MSTSSGNSPATASAWLEHGQGMEGAGQFTAALEAYDRALVLARKSLDETPQDIPARRALGVIWMNRGNALQKLAQTEELQPGRSEPSAAAQAAVSAYDEAIAHLRTLPIDTDSSFRNHLGAAWLNRGHALIGLAALEAAAESFVSAISVLEALPLAEDPSYRRNLAGARTNLAHVILQGCELGLTHVTFSAINAADAARQALDVLRDCELTHVLFAEMSLRARRALVVALGAQLVDAEVRRQPTTTFASEASDVLDEGLALARVCEQRGATHLRPLAIRLFRMGAQLYGMHQPQFLAEFLLENLDPASEEGTFVAEPEFRSVAEEALQLTLANLQRPGLIVAGTQEAQRLISTARSLRAAQQTLAALPSLPTSS